MTDSVRICAVALIVISTAAIIKQISSGFALPLRAASLILFSSLLLLSARPAVEYINGLFNITGFSKYASVMLKGFGIAMLCHGCSSVCRDCGEAAVGDYVELAGKIEIFLLCVPLINELLTLARELIYIK